MTVDFLWSRDRQSAPVGVGLKSMHYPVVLAEKPSLGFFEVHAENYMVEGGAHHRYLEAITDIYPLSLHGVGMSLGSAEGLDAAHVARFRGLVERYQPALVSEHLAWSVSGGTYLNDLLPLPLNAESLGVVSDNVSRLQDAIGRKILVENPSTYLSFGNSDIPEDAFLLALCDRAECGLLLDVNNVFVSASNMAANGDWNAGKYIDNIPSSLIGEVHLAGHLAKDIDGQILRIDDHGSKVSDPVWALYRQLISRVGQKPTLVEWDTDIPDFATLMAEAEKAARIMENLASVTADDTAELHHA